MNNQCRVHLDPASVLVTKRSADRWFHTRHISKTDGPSKRSLYFSMFYSTLIRFIYIQLEPSEYTHFIKNWIAPHLWQSINKIATPSPRGVKKGVLSRRNQINWRIISADNRIIYINKRVEIGCRGEISSRPFHPTGSAGMYRRVSVCAVIAHIYIYTATYTTSNERPIIKNDGPHRRGVFGSSVRYRKETFF